MACWDQLRKELPWLCESDRALTELAAILRATLWTGKWTLSGLGQLRSILQEMGATPATRTKITMPEAPGSDPADEFVGDPAEKYVN